jgi:transposase
MEGQARIELVERMLKGEHWQQAARASGIETSQRTAYRWLERARLEGSEALRTDRRRGSAWKLTESLQAWLKERCTQARGTPSWVVQTELAEQFGVRVSVSQINRVRAALGISRPKKRRA